MKIEKAIEVSSLALNFNRNTITYSIFLKYLFEQLYSKIDGITNAQYRLPS
jgi:hypothetical protein